MPHALGNRNYRHLFLAQLLAILSTGLATVGLALLAFNLEGNRSSVVLGTALAITMAAYLCVIPIARALGRRLPRQGSLVALDLARTAAVLSLPFVSHVWQLYALTLVLQVCSAASMQIIQFTIQDVLPAKGDADRALLLARPGFDIESLLSPTFAAVLLTLGSVTWLFGWAAAGFMASAALVLPIHLPPPIRSQAQYQGLSETLRSLSEFLRTPRFRGQMALNLSAAAGSGMVVVNTVAYVQGNLHRSSSLVAAALAVFGLGSLVVAAIHTRFLGRRVERSLIMAGAGLSTAGLFSGAGVAQLQGDSAWMGYLAVVLAIGIGYSMVLIFGGHLLQAEPNRAGQSPALARHFTLSHACWLIAYPLAGQLAARVGMGTTFVLMGALSALGLSAAVASWREKGTGPG